MTTTPAPAMFQSTRKEPQVAPSETVTSGAETAVVAGNPAQAPRILVASKTPGIAEMVGRALGQDHDVEVKTSRMTPIELLRDEATALEQHGIVVLEIAPGNDLEMQAVRDLRASVGQDTRFLALVTESITLAFARTLMEAGVDEVLPLSDVRPDLRDSVALEPVVDAEVQRRGGALHNGTIIAIAQTRGGIGATTLALNLAAMLSAPKGRKSTTPAAQVALLDLDLQNGDAAACIDIEDNGHLIDLLKVGDLPNAQFLADAMERYKDQFDVLPNPVSFAPFDAMTVEMMAQLLAELRMRYDYIVLDLPRAITRWFEPVLARTDQLLMVSDTSVAGIRQARRLIDCFTEDNPGLPIDLVISKTRKPMSLPASLKEASSFLDRPFDIWLPCDDKAARKAIDTGVPMAEAARRSPVIKALGPVVDKIEKLAATNRRREA